MSDLKFKLRVAGDNATITSGTTPARQRQAPATTPAPNFVPTLTRRPTSILDYLCSLQAEVLNQLYQDTYTCLTVFRSLPPLSKQYVMRLLWIEKGVPLSLIDSWCRPDPLSQQLHTQSLHRLIELQLISRTTSTASISTSTPTSFSLPPPLERAGSLGMGTSQPGETVIHVNTHFQTCLREALCKIPSSADSRGPMTDEPIPTVDELEAYATAKWDALLHFMVGVKASSDRDAPSKSVQQRLKAMKLMDGDSRLTITSAGFAFLFKDTATQVWDLIIGYMEGLADRHLNRDEVLRFLFRLSFMKLGQDYSTLDLSPTQHKVLDDLVQFGFIYYRKGSQRYYPTRLALNLSAPQQGTKAVQTQGFIILETTFKLYAFTSDLFQIQLINMFCRLDYRLPNLVVGTITKQSVRNALKNSITSDEIIAYLEAAAHPQMCKHQPVLPSNVPEQIRLWESERNRFELQQAVVFHDFASVAEYKEVCSVIPASSMLVSIPYPDTFEHDKLYLVCTESAAELIKQHRQQGQAGAGARPTHIHNTRIAASHI